MKLFKTINKSFENIHDNLSFDDTFHTTFDQNPDNLYLRLWELSNYSIVLGRSNQAEKELHLDLVQKDNIDIIKRSSGGGTVLLGPGCLSYTLFIPIAAHKRLKTITDSNLFIMERLKTVLDQAIKNIEIKGHTDLCIKNLKFSGNAQRRKRHSILFHGTLLYNFDLNLFHKYLAHPSKEPDYRKSRSHLKFVTNLNIKKDKLEDLVYQITL